MVVSAEVGSSCSPLPGKIISFGQRKWICVTQTWVCLEMQRARLGKAMKDGLFKKYCLRVFVRELGREKLGDCGRQLDAAICIISPLMEAIKG